MPRKYRMSARAATVGQTRQRIVEVAKTLQAAQGILGTSYEDIARHADLSPATVYRQFPSLDDLIPICAHSIQVLRPPSPESVAEVFRGRRLPSQRLELLIRGTCDCYERDQGWLHAARREEDLVPALGEVVRVQEENLHLLVRAALEGHDGSDQLQQVIVALIDFPFWQSLRRAGLASDQAADQIVQLVGDQLAKEHIE